MECCFSYFMWWLKYKLFFLQYPTNRNKKKFHSSHSFLIPILRIQLSISKYQNKNRITKSFSSAIHYNFVKFNEWNNFKFIPGTGIDIIGIDRNWYNEIDGILMNFPCYFVIIDCFAAIYAKNLFLENYCSYILKL